YESGSLRQEPERDAGSYEHADAIRVLDAWWPLLVRAQFEPGLGEDLYAELTRAVQTDESPSGAIGGGEPDSVNQGQAHRGSAFQYGWWSYVDKDLRAVLGQDVDGDLGEPYCGDGDLDTCRAALLDSLTEAVATPAEEVYPGDGHCDAGDQLCADTVIHQSV